MTLIDCMPPRATNAELVRIVEGMRGRRADARWSWCIRFDYGSIVPVGATLDDGGIRAIGGPGHAASAHRRRSLRGEDLTTVAEFTVAAGERVPFVLAWSPIASARAAIDGSGAESLERRKHGGRRGRAAAPTRASGATRSCAR